MMKFSGAGRRRHLPVRINYNAAPQEGKNIMAPVALPLIRRRGPRQCGAAAILQKYLDQGHIAARIAWSGGVRQRNRALITTILPVVEERSTATHVRRLISNRLGVGVERVTNEAHFVRDLGADWLDRLELMIVIEDQFAGLEIADDDIDLIETVGDLINVRG
jgi:acyl carrier protein